jgi:hypothetical protein
MWRPCHGDHVMATATRRPSVSVSIESHWPGKTLRNQNLGVSAKLSTTPRYSNNMATPRRESTNRKSSGYGPLTEQETR